MNVGMNKLISISCTGLSHPKRFAVVKFRKTSSIVFQNTVIKCKLL